jgi:hypothetical protein
MSLSDLAAIGSFVSGFAVLASLIFLYFQLGQVHAQVLQTEKNQRALMNQNVISRGVEWNTLLMQPDNVDRQIKILSGTTEFTEREIQQIFLNYRNVLLSAQDVHVQHRTGLLDQAIFDSSLDGLKGHISSAAFRAYWKTARMSATPEWMAYVDRLIAETPLRPRSELAAQFKADIEEVLRGRASTAV